jgi:conjugal transfer mating pair stabilization protein TraN
MPITGKHWFEKTTDTTVTAERSDAACQPLENDQDCQYQNDEVCVEGEETRVINGVPVTQPCWAWERSYQCTGTRPASDCGELDARGECEFHHQECLSEDEAGNCTVFDRWYQCIAEDSGVEQPAEFVCSGDLYCIDGECTQVERQASTEFKDAMVAIQTMGELRDDFDPDTLRLFTGENLKCTKKLFGISNCCSGKGVPLITPFVCDSEDRAVDEKDDAGLCHMVGTYCSDKVLGVCVTKKQSYCCFSSKLTRILQEQGREQLGKEWGDPEEPNCDGFLVEEFQSLDLSLMDFSEVYAEFVEAARLPDEIEAGVLIQERIAEYYDLHAGQQ